MKIPALLFIPILTVAGVVYSGAWELQNIVMPSVTLHDIYFLPTTSLGWAAGDSGTIFMTDDGGKSWIRQRTCVKNHIKGVYFSNQNNGWAIAEDSMILKTADGGNTWQQYQSPFSEIQRVFILDSLNCWVSARAAVVATHDGGKSWRVILQDSASFFFDVFFLDPKRGYVTGSRDLPNRSGAVFYTDDGGVTWKRLLTRDGAYLSRVYFIDENHGWVTGYDGKYTPPLFATRNGGKSWEDLNPTVKINPEQKLFFIDSLHGWLSDTEGNLYTTENGGGSWKRLNCVVKVTDIFFSDPKNGWVVGLEGKMFQTDNGGELWKSRTILPNVQFNRVSFITPEIGWAMGGVWASEECIAATTDGGKSWKIQSQGSFNMVTDLYCTNKNNCWAVGIRSTIVHTTDGGFSWLQQTVDAGAYGHYFKTVYFQDDLKGIVSGGGFFTTSNGGAAWIEDTAFINHSIGKTAFINITSGWGIAERYHPPSGMHSTTVARTVDGGATWKDSLLVSQSDTSFTNIFFLDTAYGWVVGKWGTIFSTPNGGETWERRYPPSKENLHGIVFLDRNKGWAVGDKGVIISTRNGGKDWVREFSGTENALYSVHFIDTATGWAAGSGAALLKYSYGETPALSFPPARRSRSSLSIIRKNGSTIAFEFPAPRNSDIKAAIYDSRGILIRSVSATAPFAGKNRIVWDTKSESGVPCSAGLYLCIVHVKDRRGSAEKKATFILTR